MHQTLLLFDSRPLYQVLPFTASHRWSQMVFLAVFQYAMETYRYHLRYNPTTFRLYMEQVYATQEAELKFGIGSHMDTDNNVVCLDAAPQQVFQDTVQAIADRYYDEFYGAITLASQSCSIRSARIARLTPFQVAVLVDINYLLMYEDKNADHRIADTSAGTGAPPPANDRGG